MKEGQKMADKNGVINNIIIESRRNLSVLGVEDLDSFDERGAIVYTNMGILEVKGANIHLNKLDLEAEEVILEGEFDSLAYVDETASKKKGFFAKLMGNE